MRRSTLLKFILIALPLLEIAVFIWVGKLIGIAWTLVLVIASTTLGVILFRQQGFKAMREFAEHARAQQAEPADVVNGSFIAIGGFLLIIPGFITDVLGLFCLIPIVRRRIVNWLILAIAKNTPPSPSYRVIDVTPRSEERKN